MARRLQSLSDHEELLRPGFRPIKPAEKDFLPGGIDGQHCQGDMKRCLGALGRFTGDLFQEGIGPASQGGELRDDLGDIRRRGLC